MTDASQADAAARRRDRVIKALLAKTVARGATPGEEAAAAKKACEIAQRYRADDKARVAASLDRFLRGRGRHGYATNKIYTTEAVAKAYPQLERALQRDGLEADLGGLVADAWAEGYEFGGERVKKPPKRRVPIPAQTAAPGP